MNCIDEKGLKQGLWKYGVYRWRNQENYGPVPGFCQTPPLVKTLVAVSSQGKYKDDKKVGVWYHYRMESYDVEELLKAVTYYVNGTIEERDLSLNSLLRYNYDSLDLTGFMVHKNDTIRIECINNMCSFKILGKSFLSFQLEDFYRLNFEMDRIASGIYVGDIWKAKGDK